MFLLFIISLQHQLATKRIEEEQSVSLACCHFTGKSFVYQLGLVVVQHQLVPLREN